jgi:GlpG protein
MIWMVGCWIATEMHLASIGNEAHLGGLLFGAAVGAIFVRRWKLPLVIPAFVLLCVASLVPLFGCPWSKDWAGYRAEKAFNRQDYAGAAHWYRQTLRLGQDPKWSWYNLAVTHQRMQDYPSLLNDLVELRKVDPAEADRFFQPDVDESAGKKAGK